MMHSSTFSRSHGLIGARINRTPVVVDRRLLLGAPREVGIAWVVSGGSGDPGKMWVGGAGSSSDISSARSSKG